MKFSFTCTMDDFAAALRLHRRPGKGHGPRMRERLLFVWLLLGVIAASFIAVIVVALYGAITGAPRGGPAVTGTSLWLGHIMAIWVPTLVIVAVIWFLLCGALAARQRRALRWMFLLIALVPPAITIVNLVKSGGPAAAPPSTPTPTQSGEGSGWSELLPWVMVFLIIWVTVFLILRRTGRRLWEAQPNMALPTAAEATTQGLRIEDAHSTRQYKWSAFTKWRESDALFMLYLSDVTFQLIPKRALATPGQVEEFRRLLEQNVPSVDPQPRGFVVATMPPAPIATAMPLPPPPLPSASPSSD